MLDDVQNAVEVEAWMPPTPVWQAPLLALFIAGMTLPNSNVSFGWAVGSLVLGVMALVVCFVDQLRRQRVMPRRLRRPLRVLVFYGFMLVMALAVVAVWSRIDWPTGFWLQLFAVVSAWVATSAVIAAGIATTNRLRDHWATTGATR